MTSVGRDREAGFTLIEVLVAMAISIPIMLALTTIMIVTLDQTQRTFTRVNATQTARNAFATIENEVHSACVGQGIDPIIAGSTPTSMTFLSYTGTDDSPTPVWHVLSFSGSTLTDTTYNVVATPGSANVGWSQGTLIGTTTLLTNASQTPGSPVFAYYAYVAYPVGSVYDWIIPDSTNLQPGTTNTYPKTPLNASGNGGLSTTAANSAVEVVISLTVGAAETYHTNASLTGTSDPVSDSISLRLTTPPDSTSSSSATGSFAPCQ